MPRRFFRRVSRSYLRKERPWYLKPFSAVLEHPTFFLVSRRSVAGAIWIGLFVALLPIPGQTVLGFLLALVLRVNVPIATVTTWLTNPVTMGPAFYATYTLGRLILEMPPQPSFEIELSWDWVSTNFIVIGKPLLLGSFIAATLIASTGYVAVSVAWRLMVAARYRRRRAKDARYR
jgi:uncharacterized protein (DUF2062 family)